MHPTKQTCLQCHTEKEIDEFFIYKKSGKHYNWCKECVRRSAQASQENHVARSQAYRQRWGVHAH